MVVHSLADVAPRKTFAFGATLGQEHIRPLQERLSCATASEAEHVIVDFTGIDATTASYVKATVLWLFQCGQLAAGVRLPVVDSDPFRPIPLDIIPFVRGMQPEVEHEIHEVFAGRKLPCLAVTRCDDRDSRVVAARLLGAPEDTARRTLEFLMEQKQATATSLHERHPKERITITGWNNRLADLYGLRLATRSKQGRQWVYAPVAEEVCLG